MTVCICSRQMMACTDAKTLPWMCRLSVPISPSGSSWRLTQGNWVLVPNSAGASVLVPARTRVIHSLLHLVMSWPIIHGGNSLIPGGIWSLPATMFQLILTPKARCSQSGDGEILLPEQPQQLDLERFRKKPHHLVKKTQYYVSHLKL